MTRILCFESAAERRRILAAALGGHFELRFVTSRRELRAAAALDPEAILIDGGRAWRQGRSPERSARESVPESARMLDEILNHADSDDLLRSIQTLVRRTDDAPVPTPCTGSSPGIRAAMRQLRAYAVSEQPLFIGGETGVGKDRAARAAHALSPRAKGAFIAFNCANLDEYTASGTLFGSVRGGYTDAVDRRGLLAEADGGTLFLDEVGSMPRQVQSKLLRAIEGGGFQRVGGAATEYANPRIISASSEDLDELAAEGRFRPDLLYRLTVLEVWIPPLRERREDIPALARELRAAARHPVTGISARAEALLASAEWPGNVRELRSVIERASILSGGEEIGPEHVQEAMAARRGRHPHARRQGWLF